jgi:hypothetical protein
MTGGSAGTVALSDRPTRPAPFAHPGATRRPKDMNQKNLFAAKNRLPPRPHGSVDLVRLGYRILSLTSRFTGVCVRSCCDLVLAGKSVEDRFAVNLVIGQVDRVWGLGLGLCRCELRQRSVWPRCVEMVQVVGEDPA